MPEENFEQQARKLTESFAMEPAPAVWQHVQAAIAPTKRRRRALLWWWLLPLCMAGGLGVWLMHNAAPAAKEKSSLANETKTKKKNEKQNNNALNDGSQNLLQRKKGKMNDSPALHLLPERNSKVLVMKKDAWRMSKKEAITKKEESEKEYRNTLADRNKIILQRRKKQINDSLVLHLLPEKKNEVFVEKKEVTAYRSADAWQRKEKKQTLLDSQLKTRVDTMEIRNRQAVLLVDRTIKPYNEYKIDSLLIVSLKDTLATTETMSSKSMTERILNDSVQRKKDTLVVAHHQKKKAKYPYSLGVQAELGTTSLGSGLSGNTDKSSQIAAFSFPGSSAVDFTNNSGNTTVTQYNVRNGVDLSIGFSVQKKLAKSIHISGQIAYRYQQFGISQTVFLDTTIQNSTSGRSGVYYHTDAEERLHFVNIYTGIGWQFFTKKKLSLSLQAGIDNAFLMSVSQKQKGHPDTIKNVSTQSFYQWQPFVHLSLPFDWYVGRQTHFELSPFVRFGVRRFQKNKASSKDNHLASAGIQVIYFFK